MDMLKNRKDHYMKQRDRIDHCERQDILSGRATERTFFKEVRAVRVEYMRIMAEQHKPLFPERKLK